MVHCQMSQQPKAEVPFTSVGKRSFFADLVKHLTDGIRCDYRYVMIYPQKFLPAFWYIDSTRPMNLWAMIQKYSDIFFRMDPLYAKCSEGSQTGVSNLRSLPPQTRNLQKFFHFLEDFAAGDWYDDMAMLIPTVDNGTIAVGLGRFDKEFDDKEFRMIAARQGVAKGLMDLHLRLVDYQVRLGLQAVWDEPSDDVPSMYQDILSDPTLWLAQHSSLSANWPSNGSVPGFKDRPLPRDVAPLDYELEIERFEPNGLTPREIEVVQHTLLGYGNIDIAQRMDVSHQVVKNMKSAVYRKLDITSEKELFLNFLQQLVASNV